MIRKLAPILGITFIDILGFSMLIPMLPYFVTHFGAAPVVAGLLFTTFSLCQLIAAPLWGNASDRIGRKHVLIISQIGATIGWATLAFAPNLLIVFIARIIEGLSGGNISITQAYVADLVAPNERARAFGYIGATFAGAMVFGPVGGGLLFARFGFTAPFLAAAALQFITLLVTYFMLPESKPKPEDQEAHVGFGDVFATLRNPHLARILRQKLALSLALYGYYSVIALYLQGQLGFTLFQTDIAFAVYAAFTVLVNAVLIGRASERFGDRRMSTIGLALLVLALALLPFVHNLLLLAVAYISLTIGVGFANTGITASISALASEREQGTVLGVSSSLDSVAGVIAPPISTGMLTRWGSPFAGIESLVFAAIALALGLRLGRPPLNAPAESS